MKKQQKIVLELKILRQKGSYEKVKQRALQQTSAYARTCGTTEAHLLIFDRDKVMDWEEAPYSETVEADGVAITLWGCGGFLCSPLDKNTESVTMTP